VSPFKLGGCDPAGVVSPPKSTVSPLAESYDMAAPDRAPGPVTFACRQLVPVHNQVSSRMAGVAVATVVDGAAEVAGTGAEVEEVDESVEDPADGSAAASPVPPKRTSWDPS
jgi:hypothetical protein